jgi:hypothetical protein
MTVRFHVALAPAPGMLAQGDGGFSCRAGSG